MRIAGEVFDPGSEPAMFGSTRTLPGVASPANVEEYDVALRPGVSADSYVQAVNGALGARTPGRPPASRTAASSTRSPAAW